MLPDPCQPHNKGLEATLTFVDASLADLDTLLAGLPAGAEVVLLQPDQDGLAQMLAALAGRSGLDALHVLTHGAPGSIALGSTTLNTTTLGSLSTALQRLSESLSSEADILFYGCDVAASDEGRALIDQIAELTGADVAASTDLTGASSLGGDWDLEVSTGAIEASPVEVAGFSGVLAPTITNLSTFSFTENAPAAAVDSDITLTGGANYGDGYIQFEVTSGKDSGDQLKVVSGGSITLSGNKVFYSGTQVGTIDSFYWPSAPKGADGTSLTEDSNQPLQRGWSAWRNGFQPCSCSAVSRLRNLGPRLE